MKLIRNLVRNVVIDNIMDTVKTRVQASADLYIWTRISKFVYDNTWNVMGVVYDDINEDKNETSRG